MRLTPLERDAMVWLGEPATAEHFVTDEMLRLLASKEIVTCSPDTGEVKFTQHGAQAYRDCVGHWPNRNI